MAYGLLAVLVLSTAVLRGISVLRRMGSDDPLRDWHLNWGDA